MPWLSRIVASSSTQSVSMLGPLSEGALFNSLLLPRAQDNALHVDAGQVHTIGIELPRLHNLFHLGDGDARRRAHHGIEVSRRLAEDQVPPAVGLPGFDERKVGFQRS